MKSKSTAPKYRCMNSFDFEKWLLGPLCVHDPHLRVIMIIIWLVVIMKMTNTKNNRRRRPAINLTILILSLVIHFRVFGRN